MPVIQQLFSLSLQNYTGLHLLYLHKLPQGLFSNYLCSIALPPLLPLLQLQLPLPLFLLCSPALFAFMTSVWVLQCSSAQGDILPICHSVLHSLTFQEADDFPPLSRIKRVKLFKAHKSDVVVWVVHNRQTCSRDAGIQISAVAAERGKSKVCISFTCSDFPSALIRAIESVMLFVCTPYRLFSSLSSLWDMFFRHCFFHLIGKKRNEIKNFINLWLP